MASKQKHTAVIIAVAALALILGVTATFVIIEAQSSRSSDLPMLGIVPQFQLTERNGTSFGSGEMLGKISVVDFFFTSCQGPCPVMSGNMSILYNSFAGSDKVQFVSISVDPTRDRLATLQEYARHQGVTDNRWLFLRGDIDAVRWISEEGFKLAAEDLPALHSTKFALVDEKGQIRGYYSGTEAASMNVLKTHIRDLVRSMQ